MILKALNNKYFISQKISKRLFSTHKSMESSLTFHKYPFLKELGLTEMNLGCYRDGNWVGSGRDHTSYNPTTNEPIAKVKMASAQDY